MSYCSECGQGIPTVPYKCRFCGKVYCPDHRLVEKHACAAPKARVRLPSN